MGHLPHLLGLILFSVSSGCICPFLRVNLRFEPAALQPATLDALSQLCCSRREESKLYSVTDLSTEMLYRTTWIFLP